MTRPRRWGLGRYFARSEQSEDARGEDQLSPLGPPRPPIAKRLNRNALTVAAVFMAMTVITAVVVLNTGSPPPTAAANVANSVAGPPPEPTFLDRPVQGLRTDSSDATESATSPTAAAFNGGRGVTCPSGRCDTGIGDRRARTRGAAPLQPMGVDEVPPELGSDGTAQPTRGASRRLQEYRAALTRSPLAGSVQGAGGSVGGADSKYADATPAEGGDAASERNMLSLGDSVLRASTRPPVAEPPFPLPADEHQSFLADAGNTGASSVIASINPAGSPYTLRAGTVIPGMLLTAITSDLPGNCMGQVTRDVYDSRTQQILLIPKGSKLICRYDDRVAVGEQRLLVAWTRLIFPDGRSVTLPGLALEDQQGRAGAAGHVDSHSGSVFGKALLLSAISAGAQLAQPLQTSILAAPSAGQIAAGAVGQEMSSVADQILRQGMERSPTITVAQGTPFDVFLNGDLVFDGAYAPEQ